MSQSSPSLLGLLCAFAAPALQSSPTSAQASDDLLPDVIVVPDALAEIRLDAETLPGRRLLRLSAATPNIGPGPLEIRGSTLLSADRQEVVQRVYRSDGTFWDRAAGTSTYHPTHAHIHFEDWAVYRLRTLLPDGAAGQVVAQGSKTSFCLLDLAVYDAALAGAGPGQYLTCGATVQGISPGWSDVYNRELPDQWIDVTDVPEGRYWLEGEVDPENRIVEAPGGETNNVARVPIELRLPRAALPDAFEPNDSMAEVLEHAQGAADSPNLGALTQRIELRALSLEDSADYFEFRLEHAGPPGAFLRLESAYLDSDLDVFLFDAEDFFVDASARTGNLEQLSLAGLPPGEYFVLVFAYSGQNPDYQLTLDPATNQPPSIELSHGNGLVWIERAYAALPVQWRSTDPDADPTSVSLFIDRDQSLDKTTLALGGYQHLAGDVGRAAVNTADLALGTWFLYAEVTDGSGKSGAWARGGFVLYLKGDLDSNGTVDRADWRLLLDQRRAYRGRWHPPAPPGWRYILDFDRDGDLDARDVRLFSHAVFHAHDAD
jgi:Lysyl oxidase